MKCSSVKLTMSILCCLPFLVKAQSVVNFSAAEGFVNGALLTSRDSWALNLIGKRFQYKEQEFEDDNEIFFLELGTLPTCLLFIQ